jgi:predicted AlkP superfamily phosphohydrolase/phosphomutase
MFHMQEFNTETERFEFVDLPSNFGQMVWDTGIETGIGFLPAHSPPHEINGRMVEGQPPAGNVPESFPEKLRDEVLEPEELERLQQIEEEEGDMMDEAWEEFEIRRKAVHRMMENYEQELFIAVYKPTDTVAHHRETEKAFFDTYERVDEELQHFIQYAERQDAQLFVVSDHGAAKSERAFFTNSWLRENGYLELSEQGESSERSLLLKLASRLIDLGLRRPLEIGNSLIYSTTGKSFKPSKYSVAEQIEWKESDAVSYLIGTLPVSGIMLNEQKLGEELEEVRDEMVDELRQRDELEWVKPREELYSGQKVDRLPHVVLKARDGVVLKATLMPEVSSRFEKYGHGMTGVFGAYGPGIEDHGSFDCDLLDFAPTLMHALEKEVPRDMDGEVREELFSGERQVEFGDPIEGEVRGLGEESDEDEIKDQLEELGYMGG